MDVVVDDDVVGKIVRLLLVDGGGADGGTVGAGGALEGFVQDGAGSDTPGTPGLAHGLKTTTEVRVGGAVLAGMGAGTLLTGGLTVTGGGRP